MAHNARIMMNGADRVGQQTVGAAAAISVNAAAAFASLASLKHLRQYLPRVFVSGVSRHQEHKSNWQPLQIMKLLFDLATWQQEHVTYARHRQSSSIFVLVGRFQGNYWNKYIHMNIYVLHINIYIHIYIMARIIQDDLDVVCFGLLHS